MNFIKIIFSTLLFVSILCSGCSDKKSSQDPSRLYDIQVADLNSPCEIIDALNEIMIILLGIMEKYDPNDHNPMISPMDEHYGLLAAKKAEQIFYRINELYPELNDLEDFDSFPKEFKRCRNFDSFVDKWEMGEELAR